VIAEIVLLEVLGESFQRFARCEPADMERLTAVITADAVRGLKLRRGDDAIAIVKSTEVMIALPPARDRAAKRNR